MAKVTKKLIEQMVEGRAYDALLASFDEDPDATRRFLVRLAYDPQAPLHDETIRVLRFLSKERSAAMPEFFLETMRRQIWAMNEEGGNIAWSAPEIVVAVVAGNPKRFGDFFSFAFEAAVDEMVFQPSLVKAFDLMAETNPEFVAEYAPKIEMLRSRLTDSNYLGISPGQST
ncbi:MAG: hypothetical protein IJ113_00760 [Eggerthellaceae bacterium]|nr:hypothetical protein [Eggerthellaceae bacterium]